MTTAAPAPTRPPRWRRAEHRIAWLFVLPALVLFLLFRFGPSLAGISLSFLDHEIGGEISWEGLNNFQRLFSSPVFWRALSVTFVYVVFSVPLGLVLSTLMALGVRRAFTGSRFFRSIFFLPVITSLVLAGAVFKWIFATDGPWAKLMAPLGLGESWLGNPALVMPAIIVVGIWSRFGYGMMILIAALQDVPRELEEAALMDGAGAWNRFRHVVLPTIRPALFFLAVIETTAAFQVFDAIYVMTGGGPASASYSLVFMLYDQTIRYSNFGMGAAVGVVLLVLSLVVAVVQHLVIGRKS
ncbi:sugar ABC transporter permease [Arachnia propionica]|uniref:Sugar ABC transporter permease n=1 Tax=Arachnia propionica TaxID=1750 RepID=A0A3P1T985_9ACTN|nr:sugar ABC transporter permease [Arachnia propionica]RRD06014.1 sugar ABC transporter permease [Arachnia propionica]